MESKNQQQKENLSVATFDPQATYAGASSLKLEESEMKAMCAPFDELDYEITPQGFIYLPQALSLKRLNDTIGIGRWGLLLINTGSQEMGNGSIKVFYDGALIIRNCFVSRSAGEAMYNPTNGNQSYASALEAAKSDCRQRCCKDLGIASDAWNPTYIRKWQKEHAIRVIVDDNGKRKTIWRRKDLDPFPNEIGIAPTEPFVPGTTNAQPAAATSDNQLPWLNHGPDYDKALQQLLDGATISSLRKQWRISKPTTEAIVTVLKKEWEVRLSTCNDLPTLTSSYNDNKAEVEEYEWLKTMFSKRRDDIKSGKVKATVAA